MSEALWNPYRPYTLLLALLGGIDGHDGLPGAMPSFRDKLSNGDLIAIAGYLRASYTTLPQWGLLDEATTQAARNDPLSLR